MIAGCNQPDVKPVVTTTSVDTIKTVDPDTTIIDTTITDTVVVDPVVVDTIKDVTYIYTGTYLVDSIKRSKAYYNIPNSYIKIDDGIIWYGQYDSLSQLDSVYIPRIASGYIDDKNDSTFNVKGNWMVAGQNTFSLDTIIGLDTIYLLSSNQMTYMLRRYK